MERIIQITAGRGPAECTWVVAQVLKKVQLWLNWFKLKEVVDAYIRGLTLSWTKNMFLYGFPPTLCTMPLPPQPHHNQLSHIITISTNLSPWPSPCLSMIAAISYCDYFHLFAIAAIVLRSLPSLCDCCHLFVISVTSLQLQSLPSLCNCCNLFPIAAISSQLLPSLWDHYHLFAITLISLWACDVRMVTLQQ